MISLNLGTCVVYGVADLTSAPAVCSRSRRCWLRRARRLPVSAVDSPPSASCLRCFRVLPSSLRLAACCCRRRGHRQGDVTGTEPHAIPQGPSPTPGDGPFCFSGLGRRETLHRHGGNRRQTGV